MNNAPKEEKYCKDCQHIEGIEPKGVYRCKLLDIPIFELLNCYCEGQNYTPQVEPDMTEVNKKLEELKEAERKLKPTPKKEEKMKSKVSESIWSNKDILIPMMDVQHIEKKYHDSDSADKVVKKGDLMGISVITKHTTWNFEHDYWENPIWLSNVDKKAEKFMQDYCYLRYELDIKPTEV